jgi:hypothetical protein
LYTDRVNNAIIPTWGQLFGELHTPLELPPHKKGNKMLLYHFSHGCNWLYNIEMTQCLILHCVYSAGEGVYPASKQAIVENTKAVGI